MLVFWLVTPVNLQEHTTVPVEHATSIFKREHLHTSPHGVTTHDIDVTTTTSELTQHSSVTKINWLMLFKETVVVCSDDHDHK
jgi:hypothetical protein